MADAAPSVSISGVLLGAMLHEAVRARGDVHGLLFGSVTTHEDRAALSDQSDGAGATRVRRETTLQAYVCGDRDTRFYRADGGLDAAVLAQLCDGAPGPLVGWFMARSNAPAARPSLRDAAVHERLCAWRAGAGGSAWPLVFLLISPQLSSGGATQSVQYQCLRTHRANFEGLAMAVRNLKHDSAAEYAAFQPLPPMPLAAPADDGAPPAPPAWDPARAVPPLHVAELEQVMSHTTAELERQACEIARLSLWRFHHCRF